MRDRIVLLGVLLLIGASRAPGREEGIDERYRRLTGLLVCACPDENWTRTLHGCPDGCANPQKEELRALLVADKSDADILAFVSRKLGREGARRLAAGKVSIDAAASALAQVYPPGQARALLEGGLSDEAILAFMEERYGPKVIATTPFSGIHVVVYIAPIVILIGGIVLVAVIISRLRRRDAEEAAAAPAPGAGDEVWEKKLEEELEEMG